MCGHSDTSALPIDEREWVCDLSEFLKITTAGVYKGFFGSPKSVAANKHASEFKSFFKGPELAHARQNSKQLGRQLPQYTLLRSGECIAPSSANPKSLACKSAARHARALDFGLTYFPQK